MEKTDPLGTQVQTLEGFRIVLDLISWMLKERKKWNEWMNYFDIENFMDMPLSAEVAKYF